MWPCGIKNNKKQLQTTVKYVRLWVMDIQRAIPVNDRACRYAADGSLRVFSIASGDVASLPLLALSLLLPTGCRA